METILIYIVPLILLIRLFLNSFLLNKALKKLYFLVISKVKYLIACRLLRDSLKEELLKALKLFIGLLNIISPLKSSISFVITFLILLLWFITNLIRKSEAILQLRGLQIKSIGLQTNLWRVSYSQLIWMRSLN